MKVLGVIGTAAVFLILGATMPAFAQEEKPAEHEEKPKPAPKKEQAKPQKQEQEAKPAKQEQAKPEKQQEAKPQEKSQQRQEQHANGHAQASHAQYAKNGQKDSRGHEYNESRFGPSHHARFEASGGREFGGRREYSYGGYWFYAGAYPPWFYQRDVYFVMGPDGLWYAVAYDDPSLTFQVNIE
jgi:hypothetical protein